MNRIESASASVRAAQLKALLAINPPASMPLIGGDFNLGNEKRGLLPHLPPVNLQVSHLSRHDGFEDVRGLGDEGRALIHASIQEAQADGKVG